MTLTEALALKEGDVLVAAGEPCCGSGRVRLTGVFRGRQFGVGPGPGVFGRDEVFPTVTVHIVLDGSPECLTALSYWAKEA